VFVGTRFPPDLVQQIDQWAAKAGVGRSEALRQLIEAGLKRKRG
jgi:metal-responsive CopG/Arc/MetJ family transcriptional regulator